MSKKERETHNVSVYAGFRPQRGTSSDIMTEHDSKGLTIKRDFEKRRFLFNRVFKGNNNSQQNVFNSVGKPIVESVLRGFNGSILAYGQTGTGKTFTMIGDQDGILPMTVDYILSKKSGQRFSLFIAAIQIYNETLSDMLSEKQTDLKFKDARRRQIFDSLEWSEIISNEDARVCFERAGKARCVGSTSMNNKSSRSHAIFILTILNRETGRNSNLYLVDLAGSERIKKSHVSGERIDEAIAINTSLTTLGKCIIELSKKKVNHVPFRESKLTKILKDALGGNCKTALIISLSPDLKDIDETISSLLFGQRAKRVQCKPALMVKSDLRSENDELKKQLVAKDEILQALTNENRELIEEKSSKFGILTGVVDWNSRNSCPVEDLEQESEQYKMQIKLLKKEHQKRLQDMDQLMLQQESEIQALRQRLKDRGKENANLREKALFSKSMRVLSEKNYNNNRSQSLDDLSEVREYLKKEMERVKHDKEKLEREKEHAKELMEKEREEIEEGKSQLEKDREMIEREKENIEMERMQMERFSDEYEKQIMIYEEKVKLAEAERDHYQSKVEAKIEASLPEKRVSTFNDVNTSPMIKRIFTRDDVQKLEEEIDGLKSTLESSSKDLERAEKDLERTEKEVKRLEVEVEELKDDNEALQKMANEQEDAKEELENKCFELKIEKETLIEENESIQKKVVELEMELESKVDCVNDTQTKYTVLQREIHSLKEDKKDLKEESRKQKLIRLNMEKEIQNLRETVNHYKNSKEEDEALFQQLENERRKTGELMRERREHKNIIESEIKAKNQAIDRMRDELERLKMSILNEQEEKSILLDTVKELKLKAVETDFSEAKDKILLNVNWMSKSNRRYKMEDILNEAKNKMKHVVQNSDIEDLSAESLAVKAFKMNKGQIRNNLLDRLKLSFFGDFDNSVDKSTNMEDVLATLVTEISSSRRCLEELIWSVEDLLWSLIEKEVVNKYQEESMMEYKTQVLRFKSVINSPEFEDMRQEFYKVWMGQLRREKATRVIQKFCKKFRQRNKLLNLQKRHRTQYERFQAGSGKYLLQMLMKKSEDMIARLGKNLESNNFIATRRTSMSIISGE